jgi:hypothetical protein
MNRLLFIAILILVFPLSSIAQKQRIIGEWITTKKDAIITMYFGKGKSEDPDKIYGKISWLEDPNDDSGKPLMDDENPDESLRNRTILGLTIIKDLEWEGDSDEWEWEDGSAYDPESGNTYKFKASMDPSSPDVLNCRGYLGFSLLGRTEVWTRKK